MADRRELARLRIAPSMSCGPEILTMKLVWQGEKCRIETTRKTVYSRRHWRVYVPPEELSKQMDVLREATLPAFPISPMVCDGEYVELTIRGEFSDLTLGWWTIAPEGAQALADFAHWLRRLGIPDEFVEDE